MAKMMSRTCTHCQETGHYRPGCRYLSGLKCLNCTSADHHRYNCLMCFRCKNWGHVKRDCSQAEQTRPAELPHRSVSVRCDEAGPSSENWTAAGKFYIVTMVIDTTTFAFSGKFSTFKNRVLFDPSIHSLIKSFIFLNSSQLS